MSVYRRAPVLTLVNLPLDVRYHFPIFTTTVLRGEIYWM